tara:strand:+ start:9069 stop:9371 length:303 start_codon:yes stop_codon:yes gene_type:complete
MKILAMLTQSKEEMATKKALRAAKSLKRKQEALIDGLEDCKDTFQAKKESLLSVTAAKIDENSWNQEYQDTQVELHLIVKQIEIANATLTELFTDEEETA